MSLSEHFRQDEKMDTEKMVSEKTPTLYMNKSLFDYENQRGKFVCSRCSLSWILAATLLILFIILTVLFLYPTYDPQILVSDEPVQVKIFSPSLDDNISEKNHLGPNKNPWDFEFLINPVNLCATMNPPISVEYQRNPEVKLLILVPSAVHHFEERKAIRNTWGSVAERLLGPIRLGFVLGTTYNKTIDDLIHQESSQFKDIIQIDYIGSYNQMTTRSILMLKWVAKVCPHAQYFLKTDDDTFVNVRTIANILNKEPYVSKEKFIGGHVKNVEPSLLPPELETRLSMESFPPYASSSYVMSIPTAIDLFGATKEVEPYFPEDDAFLTGQCANHIKVPLINEPSFVIDDPPMPPLWDTYSSLATAHKVTPDILEQVWGDMAKNIANSLFYFETAINKTGNFRKTNI